ncbi:PREDICTED: up-regulated during skeletal muscle growth protein 5 [Thamnophis sirtalis]|uniref:Up-regulated during skeletal muscle growth protein 5 n=1 Tax=Thamnophis sirtalis TaxID=35019 RepID=A0A6I9YID4_9SAUR|nr:PREDICTED: up-regulated during skeletal muscle growth protein 5 [Thamnophis sirtalis]XP_032081191.1 ATP synthase membrane subunit DAPIT, mitochondrial [Thamnophis elegans]
MAGPDSGSQHQFTGLKKYFNSYTIIGRRNYVILTYGSLLVLFLGYKMKKPKEISHK